MVSKADIGRFDGELKTIAFTDGEDIRSLLNKAGLSIGSGEMINDANGNVVDLNAPAVSGCTYYIVGNYKQGC